jgi:hypothetical protein
MNVKPKQQPSPPVLIMLFNRPEVSRRLLCAVAAGRPADLFVAADGPRPGPPGDPELCRQTRQLVDDLSWPCRVHRLVRDSNLGLQEAVTSALDWFFDHAETGIVLEDDCLPAPDFFPFAGEMLERYGDDPRVMQVSGLNMRSEDNGSSQSAESTSCVGEQMCRKCLLEIDPNSPDLADDLHVHPLSRPL